MKAICKFHLIIIASIFYGGCSGNEATVEPSLQNCNEIKNEIEVLYEEIMPRGLDKISDENDFHAYIETYLPIIENLGERSKECASEINAEHADNFIEINLLLYEMWAHLTASKETTSLGERHLLMNVEFTQGLLQKGLRDLRED